MLCVGFWIVFTNALINSAAFTEVNLPISFWLAYPMAIIPACMCFQAFLERQSKGIALFAIVPAWIVPIMIAVVLLIARRGEVPEAICYLLATSAFLGPFFAAITSVPGVEIPMLDDRHIDYSFWISMVLYIALALFLLMRLKDYHQAMRAATDAEEAGTDTPKG